MKAVILAAGMGTRLGGSMPKPLTILKDGKNILDFQVEKISKFISIDDIFIVIGYKKEMIMEKHPELIYIYNNEYDKTNTGKSLFKALNKINEDVLWLNGDVYFDEELISMLIKERNSCILVDNKKCGEEEVRYGINSDGYVSKISKELTSAKGEALGINLIRKKDLSVFKKHLDLISNHDYFEKAVENMIIQDNIHMIPVNTNGLFCHEIDFMEDLEFVRNYLSKHVGY